MADDSRYLEMQLESLSSGQAEFRELLAKLFDEQKEMRVILERNTITVEQHHRRSLALEKFQLREQRRSAEMDSSIKSMDQHVTALKSGMTTMVESIKPLTAHMNRVEAILGVFTGIPGFIKFFTMIFGLIIGAYGAYAILHDALGFFGK